MYEPQSLDALFARLQARLQVAMTKKDFGDITHFAQALEQLESWRAAEAATDLPPEVVTALVRSLAQDSSIAVDGAANDGLLPEQTTTAEPALAALHSKLAQQQDTLHELRQLLTTRPDRQALKGITTQQRRLSTGWFLLFCGVIGLALMVMGWSWLQSHAITTALGDFQTRTSQDAQNLGLLVSSALGAMSTPVAGLPTQIVALVAPLADLPGQVGQLQSSVEGMQTAVAALGTRSAEVTSTTVLAPTPDVEATLAVLRAPLEATATAQTDQTTLLAATEQALATRAAEPTLAAVFLSPEITLTMTALNATANAQAEHTTMLIATIEALATREAELAARETALAVTLTPTTTETPATEATTAETVPDPAIDESQATTDTANLPPSNTPLSITFPISGAELYIAPWVVEITAQPEVSETIAYRLLLSDTVLVPSFTPVAGQTTEIYRRTINSDFDDFPGLSPHSRARLGLDVRNQLPPGWYTLRIESVADGYLLHQVEFVIRDDTLPLVFNNRATVGLLRRPEPTDQQEPIDDRSLLPNTPVLILGKAVGLYQSETTRWCYWETVEDPRRGWTPCQFLALVDSRQPIEEVAETIPDLLPPSTRETMTNRISDAPTSQFVSPILSASAATVDNAISISFPISGAELYIAPWVVEITARFWLTNATAYRLTLNDAILVNSFQPVIEQSTYTYRRTISSDFDDFPGMLPASRASLKLDKYNQLSPGLYTLHLKVLRESQWIDLHQVEFFIQDDPPPLVFNRVIDALVRRPEPTDQSPGERIDQRSLQSNAQALVLGKAVGPYQNQPRLWCYWESVEDPRRGWTLCQFLSLVNGGQPADQVATIPDLLPLVRIEDAGR